MEQIFRVRFNSVAEAKRGRLQSCVPLRAILFKGEVLHCQSEIVGLEPVPWKGAAGLPCIITSSCGLSVRTG